MLQQKEQQIQQITQAQAEKAQEQQQAEAQLTQLKQQMEVQSAQLKAQMAEAGAKNQGLEAQFAAKQAELDAAMTTIKGHIAMLNAKEVELKALELVAAANLKQTQQAADAVINDAGKEAAITALTSKLETQQAQHQQQISTLAVQHNQQLHQEREKARAASEKPNGAEKAKPRKIAVERDTQGRIVGATVN
jgi:hypothetical protein